MIQRIQSVFILLAMLCVAGVFMGPVTEFHIRETVALMKVTGFVGDASVYNSVVGAYWFPIYSLLALATFALLSAAMFSYRKRQRQIKYCSIAFFLNILLVVALYLVPDMFMTAKIEPTLSKEALKGMTRILYPSFLPLISALFIRLAIRFIKKDEELVRSVDRLR